MAKPSAVSTIRPVVARVGEGVGVGCGVGGDVGGGLGVGLGEGVDTVAIDEGVAIGEAVAPGLEVGPAVGGVMETHPTTAAAITIARPKLVNVNVDLSPSRGARASQKGYPSTTSASSTIEG